MHCCHVQWLLVIIIPMHCNHDIPMHCNRYIPTAMNPSLHFLHSAFRQEDMQGFVKMKEIVTLSVMVWHVLEYDRYRLDCRSHGQFHSGDTYVVRWQYMFFNAGGYYALWCTQLRCSLYHCVYTA